MREFIRIFHAALLRPFRRPDVDHEARQRIMRRQLGIAARIADYRQIEAMAQLRRRATDKPEETAEGGQ